MPLLVSFCAVGRSVQQTKSLQLTKYEFVLVIPSELREEDHLDNTTLLIIIIVVIIVFGGGWYGRGRWF